MADSKSLAAELLYKRCDPKQLPFKTTAELEDLGEILGQPRAMEAVQFGLGIRREGFNLFLFGSSGTGEYPAVRRMIEEKAAKEPTPPDWCYVNNFERPEEPSVLQLPPGRGIALRDDVKRLLEELRSAIPAVFESENYRARKHVIEEEIKERREKALEDIAKEAGKKDIALLTTPTGLALAPVRNKEVMGPEEMAQLSQEEVRKIDEDIAELHKKIEGVMQQVPGWQHEGREKIRQLNEEVTIFAVGHLIEEIRKKYVELPNVSKFLSDMQKDIIENADEFITPPEHPLAALIGTPPPHFEKGSAFFRRYSVNVLVDHSENRGAPVVYLDHPTYQNLVGQVEYLAHLGAVSTDFNLIRPGALHDANGGYLILEALKVIAQPYAWDALKRALRSGEIRIESLGQMLSLVSTVSLEPKSIPLQVKVILRGERTIYYLLNLLDPEFNDLFKVGADFEERMDRTADNNVLYARLMATTARQEKLLPFDASAVARVIEHSSRAAGDSEKLLTHQKSLTDLLCESDYWARAGSRKAVAAEDVQRAIDAQIHRRDRVRQRLQESILEGTVLIDTSGERVGQVNGLSVIDLGQFAFGHPSRITARVRMGKGEVIDIEREVELSGPIHSKGVLILASFLNSRYVPDKPLSLSASLVFEQSYGAVEGDSASCAELFALLSAISEVPIRQSLAVTGSVNQHGQVQAIGGVNEKIEGFFEVCKARGLTGEQGVIIPRSNVRHLMLAKEVVDAVKAGKFHVSAIDTIDEGIELLMGMPAGERGPSGAFPEGTLNYKVEARLSEFAQKRIAAAAQLKLEGQG
jgi:lon-related putative ATP-dependent protease